MQRLHRQTGGTVLLLTTCPKIGTPAQMAHPIEPSRLADSSSAGRLLENLPAYAQIVAKLQSGDPVTFLDFMACIDELVAVPTECDISQLGSCPRCR